MFRTTPPVETMLGAHGTGALRALDAALRAFHDEDIGDDIRGATDGGGGGGVGGVGGVDGAPAPRPALLCGSLAEVQSALRTLTAQARRLFPAVFLADARRRVSADAIACADDVVFYCSHRASVMAEFHDERKCDADDGGFYRLYKRRRYINYFSNYTYS